MPHVRHYKLQRIRHVSGDLSSPRVILHDGELWRVESWEWVMPKIIRVTLSRWSVLDQHTIRVVNMAHDAYVLRYRETRKSLRGCAAMAREIAAMTDIAGRGYGNLPEMLHTIGYGHTHEDE